MHAPFRLHLIGFFICAWLANAVSGHAQVSVAADDQGHLRDQAKASLKRAVTFFREQVSSHGGYVYYVSTDLEQRWGEGRATRDMIFVQPPGTPTVGLAYMKAYQATGDDYYLESARETGQALLQGQLESGGWDQVIHFSKPDRGRMGKYRRRPGGEWNRSSLDDGQTQTALQFLMSLDRQLNFQDSVIHQATLDGLDALLAAQFQNGGFPQVFAGPAPPTPIRNASFPTYDWRTEGRLKNYWDYCTLNDGLAGSVAEVLIGADQIYQDPRYKTALQNLGDFLIRAQMPEPQPGWCQQYNYEMVPIWARKFEPPAITGSESQDAMATLIRIGHYLDDSRFLEPLPAAFAYFRKSQRRDGKLARFYELRTNRPLYMDQNYQLTYDDSQTPSHYSWTVGSRLDALERDYRADRNDQRTSDPRTLEPDQREELEQKVRRVLANMDEQGRWISVYSGERLTGQPDFPQGFAYLSSERFYRNVTVLSDYLLLTAR